MNFPFCVKSQLVIDQTEKLISSEKYVLNHIDQYMEQFDMRKKIMSDHQLFYSKGDFIKSFRTKDTLKTLLIEVKITSSSIQVTLETEVLFFLIIGLLTPVIAVIISGITFLLPAIVGGLLLFLIGYWVKWSIVKHIQKGLEEHLSKL